MTALKFSCCWLLPLVLSVSFGGWKVWVNCQEILADRNPGRVMRKVVLTRTPWEGEPLPIRKLLPKCLVQMVLGTANRVTLRVGAVSRSGSCGLVGRSGSLNILFVLVLRRDYFTRIICHKIRCIRALCWIKYKTYLNYIY